MARKESIPASALPDTVLRTEIAASNVPLGRHPATKVVVCGPDGLADRIPEYATLYGKSSETRLSRHLSWLLILQRALGHRPYCIEGHVDGQLAAVLPLVVVRGPLFGSFLVSLPYVNSAGIIGDPSFSAPILHDLSRALVSRAVELADEFNVRFLELRNDIAQDHPQLTETNLSKVHMQLSLTGETELWESFPAKVRNQVRNGKKGELTVSWGAVELVAEFYHVFAHNMRDLGTPVYSIRLFHEIMEQFPRDSEICIVRKGAQTLAGAVLLHGRGVTEVPSASSLREFNSTNANMLMYWSLLVRAIERGQSIFDFGRSSPDSGTFRFKKQWGARPLPSVWQYYVRRGTIHDMRPQNAKYDRLQRLWRRLPLPIANRIGPLIIRGIP
jgi:FemAB-related protein (PEP-CTERM system-associated)